MIYTVIISMLVSLIAPAPAPILSERIKEARQTSTLAPHPLYFTVDGSPTVKRIVIKPDRGFNGFHGWIGWDGAEMWAQEDRPGSFYPGYVNEGPPRGPPEHKIHHLDGWTPWFFVVFWLWAAVSIGVWIYFGPIPALKVSTMGLIGIAYWIFSLNVRGLR